LALVPWVDKFTFCLYGIYTEYIYGSIPNHEKSRHVELLCVRLHPNDRLSDSGTFGDFGSDHSSNLNLRPGLALPGGVHRQQVHRYDARDVNSLDIHITGAGMPPTWCLRTPESGRCGLQKVHV
jgi:hypothetical protein